MGRKALLLLAKTMIVAIMILASCGETPARVTPVPTATAAPTPPPAGPTPAQGTTVAGDPERGKSTFYAVGCIVCHKVGGFGGRLGPELNDLARRKDADYIREAIKHPKDFIVPGYPPDMPSAEVLGLNEQDIENIIAWLQSIN